MVERRRQPRFAARFRSSFSSINSVSGDGEVSDLSIRGCQITSHAQLKPGTTLQLQIQISGDGPPIRIAQAVVRWFRDGSFGCEFAELLPAEWARLRQVIQELERHPFQRQQEDTDAA